jgi:hypothetical protein
VGVGGNAAGVSGLGAAVAPVSAGTTSPDLGGAGASWAAAVRANKAPHKRTDILSVRIESRVLLEWMKRSVNLKQPVRAGR